MHFCLEDDLSFGFRAAVENIFSKGFKYRFRASLFTSHGPIQQRTTEEKVLGEVLQYELGRFFISFGTVIQPSVVGYFCVLFSLSWRKWLWACRESRLVATKCLQEGAWRIRCMGRKPYTFTSPSQNDDLFHSTCTWEEERVLVFKRRKEKMRLLPIFQRKSQMRTYVSARNFIEPSSPIKT